MLCIRVIERAVGPSTPEDKAVRQMLLTTSGGGLEVGDGESPLGERYANMLV